MIKQFYLIPLLAVVLFCSCSKSGDDGNNITAIFTPTLTIQPGTAITVYYNNTASFSWTTDGVSVSVNGVGYPSGSFTSAPLLVNTTFTVIAYGSNGQTKTVQVNVTVIPLPSDIYAAGFDGANVTYWKNGTAVPLAPVTGPAGAATGIAVSGTDVYVCGYHNGAVYWKNSTRINLTSSAFDSAHAITLAGSDVYVAGDDGAGGPGGVNAAVYWKNGVRTLLHSSAVSTSAKAIAVSGTDIHAAGYIGDTAVYWKNGVRTTLSANRAKANGIAISGTDVYVVGVENGVGYYWKNGIKQLLVGVQASVANAILVTPGPHVHAAGSDYTNKVIYWYDNTFTLLHTTPSEISGATSMCIFGPDLYLAGYVTTNKAAVYWRNGVRSTLSASTTASAAFANSIVVVQQ